MRLKINMSILKKDECNDSSFFRESLSHVVTLYVYNLKINKY